MNTKMLLTLWGILFLFFTACEDNSSSIQEKQPEGFRELLQAYQEGKVFSSATFASGSCVLNFSDGYRLSIAESAFKVYDCTESEPAEVSSSNGKWRVGGVMTDIKVDGTRSDEESQPIYVYVDKRTLYAHLSNRTVLSFWSEALEEEKRQEEEISRLQHIPVIRLTATAPIVDKKNYVDGTITVLDPEKIYSEVTEWKADMGIRGRGNSTWGWPKKPWKIKLDKKSSILGMPEDKEWALLANYADRTLLRNIVAMKLSEMCGFAWTPRIRSVEVYLNAEYQGVYTLCEHKKISSSRVNIEVVDESAHEGEALTGGYYLEIEEAQDAEVCWWTSMGVPMMFSDPEEPTDAQLAYVKGYFADFENVLRSDGFADAQNGYAAYIDVPSFVDYYIVQELTKNVDGNLRKSSFITKERGKKLQMYHLWDFDLTLGNCGYFDRRVGNGPEGFWIKDYASNSTYGGGWFWRLFQDPVFVQKVKARWNELKPQFESIPEFIDQQARILDAAQQRNFDKWNIRSSVDWVQFPSLGSYQAEVDYLKSFYQKRLEWLDRELNKL